ncbi:ABC transporter permease, partial [Lacrimispora celerecrescens]
PAVLPELFTSIRIGTGTSLAILLIVEAYGTRWGMGYYILDAWSRINYIQMYGGIVIMSVVGAALFWILDGIQWAMCKGTR